jgi:hypothetical protein
VLRPVLGDGLLLFTQLPRRCLLGNSEDCGYKKRARVSTTLTLALAHAPLVPPTAYRRATMVLLTRNAPPTTTKALAPNVKRATVPTGGHH